MREEAFLTVRRTTYSIREDGTVWERTLAGSKKGSDRYFQKTIKVDGNGYLYVAISENGKRTNHKVHLLVARTFLPNPEGLPEVNHIDRVKANCRLGNLEWNTGRQNCAHAHRTGGEKTSEYYGVYWDGERGKWAAAVKDSTGVRKFLGRWDDEKEAGRAVDEFLTREAIDLPLNGV